MMRAAKTTSLIAVGLLVSVVVVVVALRIGPGELPWSIVRDVLAARLWGDAPIDHAYADTLIWQLRLPRSLLAWWVGAALGVAGALTQSLFRNPMAEPGVLGVSAGAALVAVLGFWLGLDQFGNAVIPALAAIGALLALAGLLALSGAATSLTTLLLSGIALNALFGALTSVLLSLDAERWDLGLKIIHWLMGSFEGRTWLHVAWCLPPVVLGFALTAWLRLDLELLQLGPETAESLGTNLPRLRLLAVLAIAALVGTATALTGVIGFVGLVVPHVTRIVLGHGPGRSIPACAFVGGTLLVAVDTTGRALEHVVLPPGVITSLLGAPFFLWLLRRYAPGGLA